MPTAVQEDWPLFMDLKEQVAREWAALPKTADVVSQPLAEKIRDFKQHRQQ